MLWECCVTAIYMDLDESMTDWTFFMYLFINLNKCLRVYLSWSVLCCFNKRPEAEKRGLFRSQVWKLKVQDPSVGPLMMADGNTMLGVHRKKITCETGSQRYSRASLP